MLSMTKLYQKTKSSAIGNNNSNSSSTGGGGGCNNDPRVLTPSSIPIFILPPTRDVISNANKPELNDSCDCWSLNGGVTTSSFDTPSFINSTSTKCRASSSPNASIKNMNEQLTQNKTHHFNQLMINNTRKQQQQPASFIDKTTTKNSNNNENQIAASFKKLNQFFVNKSASASLENLKAAGTGGGGLNPTVNATGTSQRCSSPNKFNATNNTRSKKKLVKAKPVLDSNQTSFEMNNSDTLSSVSQLQQQQQQHYQPVPFLNPTITLTEAFVSDTTTASAANNKQHHQNQDQKTLFQNGYLNIDAVMGSEQSESDELESKENYCNLWVNAHSNGNLNGSSTANKSKSTSVSNLHHDEPASQSKTEEELQREYLVNLLSQLETEQQQQEHNNSLKSDFLQVNKYQQNKRSKSETLLTLVLSNHSSSSNKAIMSNDERKSKNFLSLIKRHTPHKNNSSSRKNSQNNNLLGLLDLENQKNKNHRSKSNANLNILRDLADAVDGDNNDRRFSLRSFFSKSVRSNGDKSSTKNDNKKKGKNGEGETTMTRNMSNSLSMSVNSNENNIVSLSRPMTPIKLVSLSNSTGSALRFHHSFKQNSLVENGSGQQVRTSSETNLDNNNVPLHIADSKFIRENFLTLSNKREMFQQTGNNKSTTTSSLRRDEQQQQQQPVGGGGGGDEDIDKAFSEFLTTSSFTPTRYYHQDKGAASNNDETTTKSKSSSKFKGHAHFLSFLFNKKQPATPLTSDLHDDNLDDTDDLSNPNLHRRSHTLNASGRNRFKSYLTRRKSSLAAQQQQQVEFDWQADGSLDQQQQQQPLIENNRLNLHLLQLEKEFKKVKSKKSNNTAAAAAADTIETVFINLNLAQKQQQQQQQHQLLKDGSKSSHSSLLATTNGGPINLKNVIISTSQAAATNNNSTSRENVDSGENACGGGDSVSTSSKSNNKKLMIFDTPSPLVVANPAKQLLSKSSSKYLRVHVDVSVEKLQQNMQGHLLTLNIKNLHVEPLMEINFIKARMSYLKVELMCQDEENFCENNSSSTTTASSNNNNNNNGQSKLFIKMNRLKMKKCKFDRNLKNFAKPIEFELNTEHFMSVTEEATRAQMRKLNIKLDNSNNSDQDNNSRKCYLFLFWLELHSYLPISRKTLSSTFRKQKRVFKGECQIVENFVNCTEFRKTFVICEV